MKGLILLVPLAKTAVATPKREHVRATPPPVPAAKEPPQQELPKQEPAREQQIPAPAQAATADPLDRLERQSRVIFNLNQAGYDQVTAAKLAGLSQEQIDIIANMQTDRSAEGDPLAE